MMDDIDVKALADSLRGSFPLEITEALAELHESCLSITQDDEQAYMAEMAFVGFGYLSMLNIEAAGKLLGTIRQIYTDALEKQH